MDNRLNAISGELDKASEINRSIPESVGLFKLKTANRTCKDASQRPNPKPFFDNFWFEGELCCLFADQNAGKSILAVQIATEIARAQRVLYFDFELSDKQFQMRYTDEASGSLYQFPEDFIRVELDMEHFVADESFERQVMQSLEQAIIEAEAQVLIIDNITFLCSSAEKGEVAGKFMIELKQLQKKFGVSMLILAHTKKALNIYKSITADDLFGSKKQIAFFDSAFAIGKSYKDDKLRYLKQMKVRSKEYEYTANNVLLCEIKKVDGRLIFQPEGFGKESDQLKELTDAERKSLKISAQNMSRQGKSEREIAQALGWGKTTIHNWLTEAGAGE